MQKKKNENEKDNILIKKQNIITQFHRDSIHEKHMQENQGKSLYIYEQEN